MNRTLMGWVAAAVLAVALGGVLIYEVARDDGGSGTRQAALASGGEQGLPSAVANDIEGFRGEKETEGTHELPELGSGQNAGETPRQLAQNPEQRCDPNLEPNVYAEWRNNPGNLEQAGNMADEIVVGTVQSVRQGQSFSVNVKGEPDNPQITPVQDVVFEVTESVKGGESAGSTITVQRLGDAEGCFRVHGDSPYQQGAQYLLLLEDGEGTRPFHPISPSGRYMVGENNLLQSEADNPFAEDVARLRLGQALEQLK